MQMAGHVGTAAESWPALGQLPAWPQGCAQDKVWPPKLLPPLEPAKQMVLPGLCCQNHTALAAPPGPCGSLKLLQQAL